VKTFEEALEYATRHGDDLDVLEYDDPWPHGRYHAIRPWDTARRVAAGARLLATVRHPPVVTLIATPTAEGDTT